MPVKRDDDDGLGLDFDFSPPWWVKVLVGALVLLCLLGFAKVLMGAPIPFPRQDVRQPHSSDLSGEWVMHWGETRYQVTLSKTGSYVGRHGATRYVGSWGVSGWGADGKGTFWITENPRPGIAPDAWQSYHMRVDTRTLVGKIEYGAPGVAFRLEHAKAPRRRTQPVVEQLRIMPRLED